jgi:hypothetical protein
VTEYLIAFKSEGVPERTDEELREKSRALRPVLAEMRSAGVLVFTDVPFVDTTGRSNTPKSYVRGHMPHG